MVSSNFSLNFTHFPNFLQTIISRDDRFATLFRDATEKTALIDSHKQFSGEALKCQTLLSFLGAGPGSLGVKELQGQYEKIVQNINQRISEDVEGDYHKIRGVVFDILGSPKSQDDTSQLELSRIYFELMKKSQFLSVESETLDQFSYDPGKEAAYFLNSHPDVKSIALGCGKTVNEYHSYCLHKKMWPQEWHDKAMTVDILFDVGADVVSDMHDTRLWSGIPTEYLEEVSDHTHGSFLFENASTLTSIRDALKPGGRLTFELSPDEQFWTALQSCGFVVEEGNELKNVWMKG